MDGGTLPEHKRNSATIPLREPGAEVTDQVPSVQLQYCTACDVPALLVDQRRRYIVHHS